VWKEDMLNYFNPNQKAPQIGLTYSRVGQKGWGWQVGLAHRDVLLNPMARLLDNPGSSAGLQDTLASFYRFRFILLPVAVNYSKPISDRFTLGASIGGYLGWRTHSSGWHERNKVYFGAIRNSIQGSNFPNLDTIGADFGAFLTYDLSAKFCLKVEGRASADLTDLLMLGNKSAFSFSLGGDYAGCTSRQLLFSIGYRLK